MSLFLHLYLLPLCDSTSRQSQGGKRISFSPCHLNGFGKCRQTGVRLQAAELVPVPLGAHPLLCIAPN